MATFQATSKGYICATIRIERYKSVSKTHRTKSLPKACAQEIEDKVCSGQYHKSKDDELATVFRGCVEKLVPSKKTTRFHLDNTNPLDRYLAGLSFKELMASQIVDFITARIDDYGVSTSTVCKEINTLRVALAPGRYITNAASRVL